VYVFTFYNPDAHTLHATGIYVTRVFNGHLGVCRMQAAGMFMVETGLAADEYFPQGPLVFIQFIVGHLFLVE
jgi:hypothetical protein